MSHDEMIFLENENRLTFYTLSAFVIQILPYRAKLFPCVVPSCNLCSKTHKTQKYMIFACLLLRLLWGRLSFTLICSFTTISSHCSNCIWFEKEKSTKNILSKKKSIKKLESEFHVRDLHIFTTKKCHRTIKKSLFLVSFFIPFNNAPHKSQLTITFARLEI